MLNDGQRLEAGNETWKGTVIALRDAYLEMGRTAEDAQRDAKRLWDSSKLSAEEQARVIEEIKRKMKEPVVVPVSFDVDNGSQTFPVPDDLVNPNPFQDGFASGTPGLDFVNFGTRSLVPLHGNEAVIPQGSGSQLAAEIAAALGARGGGTDQAVLRALERIEAAVLKEAIHES